MAAVELAILFSSVYFATLIVLGSDAKFEMSLGTMVLKATLVTGAALISFIGMGLYQFQQRLYFSEAAVRVFVGLAGIS